MKALRSIEQHGARADLIASLLLADGEQRQVILESLEVEERLRNLNRFLSAEVLRARKNASQ
jgi:ATP-dependent Lon protease